MVSRLYFFFFNDTATTEIYTLSLHDALPICGDGASAHGFEDLIDLIKRAGFHAATDPAGCGQSQKLAQVLRSEEHTSELQSRLHLVCRLLLEKKKIDVTSVPNNNRPPRSTTR